MLKLPESIAKLSAIALLYQLLTLKSFYGTCNWITLIYYYSGSQPVAWTCKPRAACYWGAGAAHTQEVILKCYVEYINESIVRINIVLM